MDLDGQAIERRDFPIARRGYEPAAVDAHLRELASAVEQLRREQRRGQSLGASAGTQVQGILDAAQSTAADILTEAKGAAREELSSARREAAATREDALSKANAHVAAVSEATGSLRARLEEMEAQLQALTGGLLAGATQLGADLDALTREMAALYDAAGGGRAGSEPRDDADNGGWSAAGAAASRRSSDVDGARLIALNMALNGDSREDTHRYLAENFELPDREKLVEEVFAAIEG